MRDCATPSWVTAVPEARAGIVVRGELRVWGMAGFLGGWKLPLTHPGVAKQKHTFLIACWIGMSDAASLKEETQLRKSRLRKSDRIGAYV